MKKYINIVTTILLIAALIFYLINRGSNADDSIISYVVDPREKEVRLYWKDDNGSLLKNIGALKNWLGKKNDSLLFAMNAGMFNQDFAPKGLYIENGKTIVPLDTANGEGNFYLKPNGVFYITPGKTAVITNTGSFKYAPGIQWATQSGPMLVIDGKINYAFTEHSKNVYVRNGVGILPGNKVLFAISKEPLSFYAFAAFFKNAGCTNALYLDGYVSRAYHPAKNWLLTEGEVGVMVAVTEKIH